MTRQEAIRQGSRFYAGAPCRYGHGSKRYTCNSNCVRCHPRTVAAWARANKRRSREIVRGWQRRNPDLFAASQAKKDARRRVPNCVPADFDVRSTVMFYAEARRLTRETGIPHEVDHIIPLAKGGLHAAWNLMVLTKAENATKGDGYFI